jgi:hypothetical protein
MTMAMGAEASLSGQTRKALVFLVPEESITHNIYRMG